MLGQSAFRLAHACFFALKRFAWIAGLLVAGMGNWAWAADAAVITPNANLKADGLPPISQKLADALGPYNDFRGFAFVDWHPKRMEMLVSHRAAGANTVQIYRLKRPGATPEALTDFPEPIRWAAYQPEGGEYLVYARDTGGNEAARIYRLDLATRASTLLSDPDARSAARWSRRGDQLLLVSVPLDKTAAGGKRDKVTTQLRVLNPLKPEAQRLLSELPGGGWGDFDFSYDNNKLLATQYRTISDSDLELIDLASGAREKLLPRAGMGSAGFFNPTWSRDGQRVFLTTNLNGEFLQLAVFDLRSRELRVLSGHIPWDVGHIDLSEDGRRLLALANHNGRDELHVFDADTGRELARPDLPAGAMGGLKWHAGAGQQFALSLNSSQSPGDVYSYDMGGSGLTRWTTARSDPRVDPQTFVSPELVQIKSFDGLPISAWLYRPSPARFAGKRPVLVDFHGGPESQARVRFMGRYNYLINELGVAVLLPNVRGSSGYGKTFQDLDNGFKRKDSVKDGGAFLQWLATQPGLDAGRIAVIGGSYGGYMSLAVAVDYSPLIRGAIDYVGISNFVSFLNNTESYRRDLRRVEYGDERDPAMRAFMERIAPLNNAKAIGVPLFVVQGKNDPRVPYTEAEQIVKAVRDNGQSVWYLLADNEGHGFARKSNADFMFYAMIEFLQTTLQLTPRTP